MKLLLRNSLAIYTRDRKSYFLEIDPCAGEFVREASPLRSGGALSHPQWGDWGSEPPDPGS
jgi:hypothetical protein